MPWVYDDGTPVPPNLVPPNLKSGPAVPAGPPAPPPSDWVQRLEERIMPDRPWGSQYRPPPEPPAGQWTYDDGSPVPPELVPENLRGGPPRTFNPWAKVEMNPTAQRFQDWINRRAAGHPWLGKLAPKTPGELGAQAGGTVGAGVEVLGGPESLWITRPFADLLTLGGATIGGYAEAKPGQVWYTIGQEDARTALGTLMAHWLFGGTGARIIGKLPYGLSGLAPVALPAARVESSMIGRKAPTLVKGAAGIGTSVLAPVLRAIRPEVPVIEGAEREGGD